MTTYTGLENKYSKMKENIMYHVSEKKKIFLIVSVLKHI